MGYMTFGAAIEAVKLGKRVRRAHWRDPRKFLFISRNNGIDGSQLGDKAGAYVSAVICLLHPNEDGTDTVLPGWTPLQCDMLTDDWTLFGEDDNG